MGSRLLPLLPAECSLLSRRIRPSIWRCQDLIKLNVSRMNARRHFFFIEQIALVWNSLPPSIVDFRSFSSFKRTISNAHVNLLTRYWCSVWFCYLHCKVVHLYKLCIFVVIVILLMWCVSVLRPFITNKSCFKRMPSEPFNFTQELLTSGRTIPDPYSAAIHPK